MLDPVFRFRVRLQPCIDYEPGRTQSSLTLNNSLRSNGRERLSAAIYAESMIVTDMTSGHEACKRLLPASRYAGAGTT